MLLHLHTLALIALLVTLTFAEHYTNLFAVHIEGGERKARSVAERHGLEFQGKVGRI